MLEKIGALIGLVLMGLLFAAGSETDNRGDEVRALREGNGVEVTGTLHGTKDRVTATRRAKRHPSRKIIHKCPEYEYDAGGHTHTYSEKQHCDASDWGETMELIYDPGTPERALNNSEAALATESTWSIALRVGSGLGGLACLWFAWPSRLVPRRLLEPASESSEDTAETGCEGAAD
jgi:hypothetical protein